MRCRCDECQPRPGDLLRCRECQHECANCDGYQQEVKDLKCIISVIWQRRLRGGDVGSHAQAR